MKVMDLASRRKRAQPCEKTGCRLVCKRTMASLTRPSQSLPYEPNLLSSTGPLTLRAINPNRLAQMKSFAKGTTGEEEPKALTEFAR
ncbi:hypothetical protein [Pseudomonas sp. Z3-8]|uniref:hypothetical protein n=1 Tax=Pseudomonas sp. Z3-8 TaxID=2817412 RepID=UPI003DA7E280